LLVASVSSSITTFIENHGIYAVFVLMAIDAVFPAASELVMVFGGALASGAFGGSGLAFFGTTISYGAPAYLAIALAGTLGYLVGALGGYAIGLYGGRPLVERHGRLFHLSPEQLERAEHWFTRHGVLAVFFGRLTPIVRSFISIPAGVFRDRLPRYTLLTLAGSAIWCFALAGIGYALGTSYEHFDKRFRYAEYLVVVGVVLVVAALVYRHRRSSRLARRASDTSV
jgi:membrane protein DedA with SNARE-associated domain